MVEKDWKVLQRRLSHPTIARGIQTHLRGTRLAGFLNAYAKQPSGKHILGILEKLQTVTQQAESAPGSLTDWEELAVPGAIEPWTIHKMSASPVFDLVKEIEKVG